MNPKLLIQLHLWLLLVPASLRGMVIAENGKSPRIANPGCKDICGNVTIPFPFGIGTNCYLDSWFEINCSNNKPFLSKFNIELVKVDYVTSFISMTITVRIPPLRVCAAKTQIQQRRSSIDLTRSPYSFSPDDNVFMMEGCQGSAYMVNEGDEIVGGCGTVCNSSNKAISTTDSCFGVQCCQTPLSSDLDVFYNPLSFYHVDFNLQPSGVAQNCLAVSLIDFHSLNDYIQNSSSSGARSFPPVVLSWSWPNYFVGPLYHAHAACFDQTSGLYVHCYCDDNYNGNPYVSDGCQGPEECEGCRGDCLSQLDGSGNDIPNKYYCQKRPLLNLAAILGLSNSSGLLLLGSCIYGLYRFIKRKREMRKKAKFFKRNGGLLLQQQLSSDEGVVERTKIFTTSELIKATDCFNESRILGQGGQGTVYKGMLTNASIVAIKKSKLLDETQLEQFINEVVILSRINHRHVVKLFGCCLETEVPLLVYEFVPNGTLYQHIHDPDEDFVISWAMRLKIAADSAGAIAYLHSSSTIPIYHRDIKSSNILLDEKLRAKVSDFGSSKTLAMDQTHMTTLVQGTMGYLDPEYFQSYQFTEKSDVYSFGVVLLELLTSKKPIYRDASSLEQKNLVTEFLFQTHNSNLSEILDPKILNEAKEDELTSFVELAKRCICWSGKLRPTMKEVVMTLEMIIKSPAQVCSWYRQQETFPIQYAAYDEFDMSGISDSEFMSNTVPAGVASPSYSDERRLLPDGV